MTKHKPLNPSGGKGSADRTTDMRKYLYEFDRIFGNKPVNEHKKVNRG